MKAVKLVDPDPVQYSHVCLYIIAIAISLCSSDISPELGMAFHANSYLYSTSFYVFSPFVLVEMREVLLLLV